MDIKAKIEELTSKVQKDPSMMANFQKNPVKTVESLLGVDLPDDQIQKVVDGIKAKISVDKLGDTLGGLFGKK